MKSFENKENKKIVFALNHSIGMKVLKMMSALNISCIEHVILHPKGEDRHMEDAEKIVKKLNASIIRWSKNIEDIVEKLKNKSSEILFVAGFGYKIPNEVIQLFKKAYNLHLGFLPDQRGRFPTIWAIIDGTRAGATIHRLTSKIDSGKICIRKEVPVYPWDTGRSLFERVERAGLSLFLENIESILQGTLECKMENTGGTYHYAKEVKELAKIDLNKTYTGKDIINILRALTFPPYKTAFFEFKGRKIYIDVNLYPETPEVNEGDEET